MNNLFYSMLNIFTGFLRWMEKPVVWVILLCAVVGISLSILARRITRIIRKRNTISDDDKVLTGIKFVAISFLFVSILMLIFILM